MSTCSVGGLCGVGATEGGGARSGGPCPEGADRRGGYAGLRGEGFPPGYHEGGGAGGWCLGGDDLQLLRGQGCPPADHPRQVERDGAAGGRFRGGDGRGFPRFSRAISAPAHVFDLGEPGGVSGRPLGDAGERRLARTLPTERGGPNNEDRRGELPVENGTGGSAGDGSAPGGAV